MIISDCKGSSLAMKSCSKLLARISLQSWWSVNLTLRRFSKKKREISSDSKKYLIKSCSVMTTLIWKHNATLVKADIIQLISALKFITIRILFISYKNRVLVFLKNESWWIGLLTKLVMHWWHRTPRKSSNFSAF